MQIGLLILDLYEKLDFQTCSLKNPKFFGFDRRNGEPPTRKTRNLTDNSSIPIESCRNKQNVNPTPGFKVLQKTRFFQTLSLKNP